MNIDTKQTVYRCLVVDDEPIARQIVCSYVAQMPMLQVVQECKNGMEALAFLQKNTVDIIFLDINMPNFSGLAMVKTLAKAPRIIFTTAYHEYALESYELNATDYLLKPFSLERFAKAVFKATEQIEKEAQVSGMVEKNTAENLEKNSINKADDAPESPNPNQIFIKADGKLYQIHLSDILFCEAMKNYTRITLKNGNRLTPLLSFSKMQELLPNTEQFVRIHRSYIVAKPHIEFVEGNAITIGNYSLPIGDQYKEEFFKIIDFR
jgi:DNA-binding LytR/AlgR family response regulator